MNESILNRIHALIELESASDKLAKMPKNFYRDVAICMKKILNGVNQNEKNIVSNLALEERRMIEKLIDRLIELRVRKASQLNNTENLTPEERYIMEPLLQSDRRRKRVGWAIKSGQPSRLDAIYDDLASRLTMVRFLQPTPPIMGIDLRKYGPFEKEDVAIIPSENAKPLIKQNVVNEVWLDECNL